MTYLFSIPSWVPHDVDDGQNRTIMMTYLIPVPSQITHDVNGGQIRTKTMTYLVSSHNADDGRESDNNDNVPVF